VALVGVRFSRKEYDDYDAWGVQMAAYRSRLVRSGLVRTEPIGAFLADVARCARDGSDLAAAAMGYLWAMAERRRQLAETPAKLAALAAMRATLAQASRAIVFTQSIQGAEQAAELLTHEGLAAGALHSGLEGARRRDRLARFVEGGLTVLCAPTVLDEGVDVPAADLAVVLAASRSRRQMVQRMGRVLRRKPDGRPARFVVVYVIGTNEDPAAGAHEGFLDEVAPVAISVQTCPADAVTANRGWPPEH
jgi:superfamily II DNA or RNA helicase